MAIAWPKGMFKGKSRVVGAKALQKKLRHMPLEFTVEIKDVLIDVADDVLGEMRQRTPVSDWWDTKERGHMRDELDADVDHKKLTAKIGFISTKARNEHFYAKFIEYGTRKMGARPFIFPAWMARREDARRRFMQASKDAFKKGTGIKFPDV